MFVSNGGFTMICSGVEDEIGGMSISIDIAVWSVLDNISRERDVET